MKKNQYIITVNKILKVLIAFTLNRDKLETEHNLLLFSIDFKINETHLERIEVFSESDPNLIIEDFGNRWSIII